MLDTISILTPEKAIVSWQVAGLWPRIGAQLVDVFCLAVLMMLGTWFLVFLTAMTHVEIVMVVWVILGTAMPFLYFIVQEGLWNGRTLGKAAAGIKVVQADGTPITMRSAVLRNLLRPADFLPVGYAIGALSMFLTPRFQRVGDIAADTMVVRQETVTFMITPAPHRYGIHAYEDRVGVLDGMTMQDYMLLKRVCDRYYQFTPEAQAKIINEVWKPLETKLRMKQSEVHPIYLMEAVVMKYGRQRNLV